MWLQIASLYPKKSKTFFPHIFYFHHLNLNPPDQTAIASVLVTCLISQLIPIHIKVYHINPHSSKTLLKVFLQSKIILFNKFYDKFFTQIFHILLAFCQGKNSHISFSQIRSPAPYSPTTGCKIIKSSSLFSSFFFFRII